VRALMWAVRRRIFIANQDQEHGGAVLVAECSMRCRVHSLVRGAPTVQLTASSEPPRRPKGKDCAGIAGRTRRVPWVKPVIDKVLSGSARSLRVLSLGPHCGPAWGISVVLPRAVPPKGLLVHCAAAPVAASSVCRCSAKNSSITGSQEQEGGRDDASRDQNEKRQQAFRSIA